MTTSNPPQPAATNYGPGHPWHYLAKGDNRAPVAAADIPAAQYDGEFDADSLPNDPTKREHAFRERLADELAFVTDRLARYEELLLRGVDVLSEYDREIAYGGDDELARAGALALLYSQIAYSRGKVAWYRTELDRFGPTLFGW